MAFTVLANAPAIGTVYRIRAWGNIDNGTTAVTFTPRIRWGGVAGVQLLATPTIVGTTTAQTNRTWYLEAYVVVVSIGAAGTARCAVMLTNHSASTTGVFAANDDNSGAAAVTVATNANKDLVLTWTMSSVTGSPHVRTLGASVELVKA